MRLLLEKRTSMIFETSFWREKCFFLDSIETDGKITKQEASFGSNDVKFSFARGEKIYLLYAPNKK